MKGDFSRFTFDERKHYAGVLHQQGRVWLDSDWNEEVLERLALLQQELNDVIGPSGTPAPGSGFQLSPSVDPNAPDDFGISAGHCYVNGVLCQLEANTSYLSQPDFPDPPHIPIPRDGSTLTAVVYLEVWQRLITYLEDDSIREIALGGPDTSTRLKNIVQLKVKPLPGAVGALSCDQGAQFLPGPGSGTLTTLQPTNVQPQSLCQLPDPANFTGRENHLYRVQVHDGGDVIGASSGGVFTVSLASNLPLNATTFKVSPVLTGVQADALTRANFVTLSDNSGASERVRLAAGGVSSDDSTITLAQGASRAYTMANGATVSGGVARFKWSRDNAAFAVKVTAVQPDRRTVTLSSLGRDVATMLRQGDLVEVADDASELGPGRGHLTFLASDPDPDKFTAVLADPIPPGFLIPGGTGSPPSVPVDRHMVLRRWDGIGDAAAVFSDTGTPGMNLGDGVHVQFGGQNLAAGDYWQFTTRTADGSVQPLLNASPAGVTRFRAPLAIVSWGPPSPTSPPSSPPPGAVAMNILTNCLPVFPALINFPQIEKGIHIVGLSTVDSSNKASPLFNDANVTVTSFAGINIQCDANVDPVSIARPTCFVMVEFPLSLSGGSQVDAFFPVVLAGSAASTANVISWTAGPQGQAVLNQLLLSSLSEQRILARLTLKGNFIWSQDDPTLFLDGDVFGRPPGGGASNISLRLPSGDRRRGGDFEMWFWVKSAPSFITGIQANPPSPINVGDTTTVTMTLSAPAPQNSVVTLTLSNSNVLVPAEHATSPPTSPPSFTATVAVGTGTTSATVVVTGQSAGPTTFVTASFGGQSVALPITVQPLPSLTQLALNPTSVFVSGVSTATVVISGPAPSAGLVIALSTSDSSVATVPSTITLAAGSTSGTFTVNGVGGGTATITATASVTLSALFTVVVRKGKEKEKDIAEKRGVVDKIRVEKIGKEADKVREILQSGLISGPSPLTSGLAPVIPAAMLRGAFISAEERPAVGDTVLNPQIEPEPELGAQGEGVGR